MKREKEVLVLPVVAVRCHIARSHGCKLEFSGSGRVKRRRKRTRQISSAVINLTWARFPKWKELKSSKTFWLHSSPQDRPLTWASWSWRAASDQEFRHVWTFPHRPCHGKEGPPWFAACPARCARCKYMYHARHYYPVIFGGSTRQGEAITIIVRFVNEQ